MAVRTTREVYANNIDSVILVSSDSDYWAMIKDLSDINFLVLVEKNKTSNTIKESLYSKGIHYCYMDDFYTGMSYSIKIKTLKKTIQDYLDSNVKIDGKDILDKAIANTWIEMTEKEKRKFFEKYITKAHLEVDCNGGMRVKLGAKGEE